ncbi:MAG: hypothetical protein NW224_09945 [Leptolyngbyaceae cyanobacterium bins.302]|nr:hypothetical protein [Leptolyngbyaceae cyanobacterium bins.302]
MDFLKAIAAAIAALMIMNAIALTRLVDFEARSLFMPLISLKLLELGDR